LYLSAFTQSPRPAENPPVARNPVVYRSFCGSDSQQGASPQDGLPAAAHRALQWRGADVSGRNVAASVCAKDFGGRQKGAVGTFFCCAAAGGIEKGYG